MLPVHIDVLLADILTSQGQVLCSHLELFVLPPGRRPGIPKFIIMLKFSTSFSSGTTLMMEKLALI